MTKLSQQLSDIEKSQASSQWNGIIESNSVYVTSVPDLSDSATTGTGEGSSAECGGGSTSRSGSQRGRTATPDGGRARSRHSSQQREPSPRGQHAPAEEKSSRPASRGSRGSRNSSWDRDDRRGAAAVSAAPADREIPPEAASSAPTRRSLKRASAGATTSAPMPVGVNGAAEAGVLAGEPLNNVRGSGHAKNRMMVSHNDSKRSSKESLSSQRSSRAASRAGSAEQLHLEAVMSELDRGPHREMAVDVPESFIARTKTPPRYPPPRAAAASAGSRPGNGAVRPEAAPRGSPGAEPPAPAPRTSLDRSRGGSAASRDSEPSREQMERIRKYQEDIRKDRELRQRRGREEEFLRSSLRGSEKMRRLQQNPPLHTGYVNSGCVLPDDDDPSAPHAHAAPLTAGRIDDSQLLNISNLSLENTILNKIYPPTPAQRTPSSSTSSRHPSEVNRVNAGIERGQAPLSQSAASSATNGQSPPPTELAELLTSLRQIQRALQSGGHRLDKELATAQTVLTSPEFQRVLAVHNRVQQTWCVNAPPSALCCNAQDIVQEAVGVLQESSTPESAELVDLLTQFDMEGLMYSHDQIAARGLVCSSPEPGHGLDDYAERVHHYTDPRVRVIRLEKTTEPLGATVKNEADSVLVGRIVKGGAADKSGLLRPGDEILEVNGIEMRGKTVDDVCDILAGMTGCLVFLTLPREEEDTPEKTKPTSGVLHVKAHFDYDPEDDLYMPCREIGMSFQKGDILHVTSQDDPDWWQATRDGDEDLPLSGLIPSMSFQTQRETLKQSIIDSSRKEGKKSKFLCAKRTNKKKRKMYNAEYNDDYEANEILTYEEVGLYYPRANHKRPVVLIGPPNIGRHELRQRLMEDTDRFSAAVPHTSRPRKESELDGQDYHFISRAQFEQDIVNRLFVEHGEYERAYYGTSVAAIRTVVGSGKICVLNLHPHSLKILKNTDLKPFVVFVAPPSLEKLRQMKLRANEQVRDEELKQIIEKAREIEEVYGHYFDIVIINSDLGRAYEQLIHEINTLEREPQWVPAAWLRQDLA